MNDIIINSIRSSLYNEEWKNLSSLWSFPDLTKSDWTSGSSSWICRTKDQCAKRNLTDQWNAPTPSEKLNLNPRMIFCCASTFNIIQCKINAWPFCTLQNLLSGFRIVYLRFESKTFVSLYEADPIKSKREKSFLFVLFAILCFGPRFSSLKCIQNKPQQKISQ